MRDDVNASGRPGGHGADDWTQDEIQDGEFRRAYDDAEELAEAISKIPEIARRHGPYSDELGSFLKQHSDVPGFTEFADECLRLEFSTTHDLGSPPTQPRARPPWAGFAAGALVMASVAACAFGLYALARWNTVAGRGLEIASRDRAEFSTQIERAKGERSITADAERLDLRNRLDRVTAQLADETIRAARLQEEASLSKSRLDEKDRELLTAYKNISTLESEVKGRGALDAEVERLRKLEDIFFAQTRAVDRVIATALTTNVQSMIVDASLLRLIPRPGLTEAATELIRKLTDSDISDMRTVLAEISGSITASDPDVSPGTIKNITTLCNSTGRFAVDFGTLDPLTPPLAGGATDQIASVALLNYSLKKQLYALDLRRASGMMQDVDMIQRIQSHANHLESAALEIRKQAVNLAPTAAVEYVKKRDDVAQHLITLLKETIRDIGGVTEARSRKDR